MTKIPKESGFKIGAAPGTAQLAVQCWNLMGGEIKWSALPILCEMFGIEDVELLVRQLNAIRDSQVSKSG